ncbi:Meiotic sister chromatid recombination 1-like protein [Cladobotryum mycophilum]|uniref:Meiotic sister chromatid recombination 1-like protein n=1 Tax=Cladobotryum mycophilum TaxID=491253 RepID=A0ABR0SWP3_9HYPO
MMLRLSTLLTAGLALTGVAASGWFPGSKSVYNKWHETEIERWLSDHDIPYPTPADRKDLEDLVGKHWNDYVVEPYSSWDTSQLSEYLTAKGKGAKEGTEQTKDNLLAQVKANWYESEDNAQNAFGSTKDWILDTWTDSQLKAFCDKNGIPVPQPRERDTLLQKARSGYETAAKKIGESIAYPGNWLYSAWSESDLKEWLDSHGFPAPQPSSRDKLVASVRRNSRLAYLKAQKDSASATESAKAAYATLTDVILDAWSDSQLKDFCDKNGIPVPQGSKTNDLRALIRKHRAEIFGDNLGANAASAFGAATSNVKDQYAQATDIASEAVQQAFGTAVDSWSESRLKAYLDARGIPVPQSGKADELRALVRKNAHKASSGWQAWTFDDFSVDNLKNYLNKNGNAAAKAAAKKKDATREDLVSAAQSAYSSASSAGGSQYASATSYLASVTAAAKSNAFETWTESDLKAYLDSYGIPVPQGSRVEELRAAARKQSNYFRYGTSSPGETVFAKIGESAKGGWKWVADQLHLGNEAAREKAAEAEAEAKAKAEKLRQEL